MFKQNHSDNEWNIEYKREENRNENRKQKIEKCNRKIKINKIITQKFPKMEGREEMCTSTSLESLIFFIRKYESQKVIPPVSQEICV